VPALGSGALRRSYSPPRAPGWSPPTLNTAFIYGPQGVRCNAVAPGPVATSIEAPWKSQLAQARIGPVMQAVIPPVAQPEQLAATICWLASDDAANVNGVVLPSDGGWSAI
jgi:NAD(P)-dependent dehydrogenase (short-subunit alcohol dehydrogenase family)